MNSIVPALARSSDAERRMPRRTSGSAARRSIAANAASRATLPARPASVRAMSASGARTTV